MDTIPLMRLDLARNAIRDKGASALGLALQRTSHMQELSLRANGVMERGALALAVAVKNSEHVHTVDLRGNSFPFTRAKIKTMLEDAGRILCD